MSARCVDCGAINPWNPETDADLYGFWTEQHSVTEDSAIDASTETEQAAAARTYAAADMAIFPVHWPTGGWCSCRNPECKNVGKHPITGNGFKDASADVDQVVDWWRRWPLANIGLPTGANQLGVVDVDNEESFTKLREYLASKKQPLPDTVVQITGSGKRHFVFADPDGIAPTKSRAFGLPGIDTRGVGGYIVAAPSVHAAGGVYEWVNPLDAPAPWPALLSKLANPPKPAPVPYKGPRPPIGDRYAAAALDKELAALTATTEGGRNDRLNVASFALGQLVAGGLLDEMTVRRELYRAALSIGLGEGESAKTIASGMRGGMASPRTGRAA